MAEEDLQQELAMLAAMEPVADAPVAQAAAEDSADEDEKPVMPASSVPTNPSGPGSESLTKAWMLEDAEDEEEEDADLGIANATKAQDNALVMDDKSPKFQRCWAAVKEDQWNADAWIALLTEVQLLPITEARAYYERFLEVYPTSGRWWKLYAEHELQEKNYERVQEIIKKSLMQIRCPHVDLWRFYLTFTKVVKVDVAVDSKDMEAIRNARQLMCDAFELAIERVGGSIHAAPIWQAYISFLQEDPSDPQAFLFVRKLYHRAVAVPLHNVDAIWRDYEKFERSIPNNDALAQNFFKVLRPKLDAARAVLRDRKKLFDHVNINALAVPPSSLKTDAQQMTYWQEIATFELGNPERLDPLRLKSRLRYTMELIVSIQRHYPEAWYQYATYESETNNDREAANGVFDRAFEAIPESMMLSFAYADHHELHGDLPAAKAIYEKLIKDQVSPLIYITYQRFARRAYGAKGPTEARTIFKRARKDEREGACTYHVFAASALLEFYSDSSETGKDIALKIFELGLKTCIQEPAYVLSYLDFLGHFNDDNNMRSLFEKVLAVMPPEVSRPIWDRYVDFEHTLASNGGDLATVAKVEARRAMAFPEAPVIEMKGLLSIAHRYAFLDLLPPSKSDQAFFGMYGPSKRGSGGAGGNDDFTEDGDGSASANVGGMGPESEMHIPGPPLPAFLKDFAMLLPLHLPWNGPIADVEHIYRAMLLVDFPPRSQIELMQHQKQAQQQHLHLQQQHLQLQQQQAAEASAATDKAHAGDDGSDRLDGPGVSSKRPAHDVFRARQQQKLAKLG